MLETEKLALTDDWDKTFPKSDRANHRNTEKRRIPVTSARTLTPR